MPAKTVVAVSGGFDPIHIGHTRYIEESNKLGDELVVILNNDNWLINKKGFVFMPQEERKEVLEAIRGVSRVVITDHELEESDRSVCRALREIRPHIFSNGGDRKPDGDPVPEVEVCNELGIQMVYNVGYAGKVQSSSWLTGRVKQSGSAVAWTPWNTLTRSQQLYVFYTTVFFAVIGAIDIAVRVVY